MIDGSEKRNGWLNFERQSPHVIENKAVRPLGLFIQPSGYELFFNTPWRQKQTF